MRKEQKLECEGFESCELEAWINRLGSPPVELIHSIDVSLSYEMYKGSVVRLADGRYATILENGCSCYNSADADIEHHPTKEEAVRVLKKFLKEQP